MRTTVTMTEGDIGEAVSVWLTLKGLKVKGPITINHDPGDRPGDSASTSIDVETEPLTRGAS